MNIRYMMVAVLVLVILAVGFGQAAIGQGTTLKLVNKSLGTINVAISEASYDETGDVHLFTEDRIATLEPGKSTTMIIPNPKTEAETKSYWLFVSDLSPDKDPYGRRHALFATFGNPTYISNLRTAVTKLFKPGTISYDDITKAQGEGLGVEDMAKVFPFIARGKHPFGAFPGGVLIENIGQPNTRILGRPGSYTYTLESWYK